VQIRSGRCGGVAALVVASALLPIVAPAPLSAATRPPPTAASVDRALSQLVASPGGPPGVAVVIQRGPSMTLQTAGTSTVGTTRSPALDDHMRLASVAKAFSGAVALSLVHDKLLSLGDTIGQRLPSLPSAWKNVTLTELLNHTSGIPDFTASQQFRQALMAAPLTAPPPSTLLSYVSAQPLQFKPGSRYHYSNSDNIIIGLMAEAATGRSYETLLQDRVYGPFGLAQTSLPRDAAISAPLIHGFALEPGQPPQDATGVFAAGWAWASGGIVSTPKDANTFIRAYARGTEADAATRAQQFHFTQNASSQPPGPGANSAGLGIFRYQTSCGTVYGHTGNTAGYTQFVAATSDGSRSVTVSVNAQIEPKSAPKPFALLQNVYRLAVCAAITR
jgi:D-alanyl-D-alanine carboxypeptidase